MFGVCREFGAKMIETKVAKINAAQLTRLKLKIRINFMKC